MLELSQKPKNAILIEGFPGFGFVSTIATEFLIKHLDAKKIGRFFTEELLPLAVIKDSKVIDPLEVFYAKKENILILRTLTNVNGAEWKIAEIVRELAKELKVKEIISVEGIANPAGKADETSKTYYFTNQDDKKFKKLGIDVIKEGIVMGVTGVLLMKADKMPVSCFFAEATPGIPDSRAAGEIIKTLDNYLNLNVDYKPLMKTAQEVEGKIRDLLSKIKESAEHKDKKEASYLG
jgi:predicted ATP-grasp superfamily ATP-dependent carboligase